MGLSELYPDSFKQLDKGILTGIASGRGMFGVAPGEGFAPDFSTLNGAMSKTAKER